MDWWHETCHRLENNDPRLTELDLHRRLLLWSQQLSHDDTVFMPLAKAIQNHRNTHLTTLSLTMLFMTETTATCLARALSCCFYGDRSSASALKHLHIKDEAMTPLLHEDVWRILLLEGIVAADHQRDHPSTNTSLQTLGLAACTRYGDIRHLVQVLPFIQHLELDCHVFQHDNNDALILAQGFRDAPHSLQSLTCMVGDETSALALNRIVDHLQQRVILPTLRELTLRKVFGATSFELILPSLQRFLISPYAPHQLTLQAHELTKEEMQFFGSCLVTAANVASDSNNHGQPHDRAWQSLNLSHCRRLGGESSSSSSDCDGLQYIRTGLLHPQSTLSRLILADTAMGNDGLQLLLFSKEDGETKSNSFSSLQELPSCFSLLTPFLLHTLDLTRCNIDDVTPLESIVASSSSRLQVLNLNGNMISDDGARRLGTMLQRRQEQNLYDHHHCSHHPRNGNGNRMELSLSWNRIGTAGAVALVTSSGWTALNLSWNSKLGYEGLQTVAHALMQQRNQAAGLSQNFAYQQQRLDLSHTVKLGTAGGGFRLNKDKNTNDAAEEKKRLLVQKATSQAVIQAIQHSYRLIEFQVEGCELFDEDLVEEQIQFYTTWNRRGRYLLLSREDESGLAIVATTNQVNFDETDNSRHLEQSRHHAVPMGLWSLVLANVADNPSLIFSFVREQPYLIPSRRE